MILTVKHWSNFYFGNVLLFTLQECFNATMMTSLTPENEHNAYAP